MPWRSAITALIVAWVCAAQPGERVRLVVQSGQPNCPGVAFSPDGRMALTGCMDNAAWLWDVATGRLLRRLTGHSQMLMSVAFSPDGRLGLTASRDGTARLWDLATGKEIRRLVHGQPEAGALNLNAVFSPDGRRALTTLNGSAQLWDLATGTELRQFAQPSSSVVAVAFSPDGHLALTGDLNNAARLWDVDTGRVVRQLPLPRSDQRIDAVMSVAFSPDGRMALTGMSNGLAHIWDVGSGREVQRLTGHDEDVFAVSFSPDGRVAFTGGHDGSARLWDVATGKEIRRLDHLGAVSGVAFSPDGHRALTGGWFDGMFLWDIATGKQVRRFAGHSGKVRLSPDHRLVLAGQGDRTRAWDLSTGKEVNQLSGSAEDIVSDVEMQQLRHVCAYSTIAHIDVVRSAGLALITGLSIPMARLCDLATGKPLHDLGSTEFVQAVALSRDGRLALTGSYEKTARLWDVATGLEVRQFPGHTDPVRSVAFSPDGRLALTASGNVARLWEVATGKLLRTMEGHSAAINSTEFSPDGRLALTGSFDRTARLWDLTTGKELQQLVCEDEVNAVAFASTGQLVLTWGSDETTRLWRAQNGRQLATLVSFDDGTWAVTDSEGRYDSADPDNAIGMHWVAGDEVIELGQLKHRFYTPGLLTRSVQSERLPSVAGIQNIPNPPQVDAGAVSTDGRTLKVRLTNRGGGLGRVMVSVNGREVPGTARGEMPDSQANSAEITLHLDAAIARPDGQNTIEIRAFDSQELIASRGSRVAWKTDKVVTPTHFFAVVAGTSEYAADALRLKFAAKDAQDMARALRLAAEGLFGRERVDVRLFATGTGPEEATKDNLRQAFADIAGRAQAGDILLVYFAGHGVTVKGAADRYFYLTKEARSTDLPLNDQNMLDLVSVSSEELRDWCWRIKALKQVFILDTCAAGGAVGDLAKLSAPRDLSPDQRRAIESLKDATGSHILMGAAADAVSYEAGRYGQGLLTYALLSGLKGAALEEGGRVEVRHLFDFAQRDVEQLARGIGGVQRPQVSSPQGSTFPIGFLTEERRREIPLAAIKPQLMQLRCHDQRDRDPLHLEPALRAALREVSSPVTRGGAGSEPPIVYLDSVVDEMPDAISPRVTYEVKGETIELTSRLDHNGATQWERTVTGPANDLPAVVKLVLDTLVRAAQSQ